MNNSTIAGRLELKRKEMLKKKSWLLKTGFLLCTATIRKGGHQVGLQLVKMWIDLAGERLN